MINYDLLNAIPPDCSYDEWMKVGMALKHEGASVDVWDSWSRGGSKYKAGECERKWKSFQRSGVTGGTLHHIAAQYGYSPAEETETLDIHNLLLDELIVDPTFVSKETVPGPPANYDPKGDMLEYFTTLFHPDEFVGYCIDFWRDTKEERWKPKNTIYRRTAGDIIERLRAKGITDAIGTTNPAAGAYVRFNPLDGKGENNANVTRWKHCLIESDKDDLEKQYALFKAMNLPITFLVNSGGKSLHALVRVDAENAQQYRQRVRELYEFCKKSGLTPDEQDKNESRFSRLPGVQRAGRWQYIVERNIGAESYDDWIEWRQSQADDLPEDVTLADVWDHMPPLKEELIPGVLRVGHKLLLAGPSKAGKSFLLINLAISIAEGEEWLGLRCKQGKVVYINLELDSASCFDRFKTIYERRGLDPNNLKNITILNLRGRAKPLDRLVPILIKRFKNQDYAAVIIDPIYKVITGDENNATEMGQFCNNFDQIATDLAVSVIYCHHHSKGAGGKYANAADRSSGSGVFARDPDAILDLRELNVSGLEDKYKAQHPDAAKVLTGWELNGTLREFAPMETKRVWFDYPLHRVDDQNFLGVATFSDSGASGRGTGKDQTSKTDWYQTVSDLLDMAALSGDTAVTLEQVGIKEHNAKKVFTAQTLYEMATVGGVKVIHKRDEDEIVHLKRTYQRFKNGNSSIWKERVPGEETL